MPLEEGGVGPSASIAHEYDRRFRSHPGRVLHRAKCGEFIASPGFRVVLTPLLPGQSYAPRPRKMFPPSARAGTHLA